ncbi:MAG: mandelate racemase/muconate lactonizing enzyme family protein [Thermomicrobiales bacterium]|nr:mandelate racemase/muconate lactonizing enzyme family protein [Thermomicrobiales bacterium]
MKITKIETIVLEDFRNLIFLAVHTDEGLTGYADTYYMADAVRGFIHEFAAPMLLGRDPCDIELHWRRLYEVIAHIAGKGAEIRGLSALDVALWDILGQAAGMPIWRVLGGAARERIKTYNTCGGPAYGRPTRSAGGYGVADAKPGRYEDLVAFMTDAGALALDLLEEGIDGMKVWPLDSVVHHPGRWDDWQSLRGAFDPELRNYGGSLLDDRDLARGLEPVRKIREAAGDRMAIMFEGHGFWSLPAAKKIARALEEFRPAWIEDLMRADDIGALAELQRSTTIPVLASEYLTTRYEYKPLLEQRAADIVMIDPTWAGGITESKKIATLADAFKRPVAMHDCTGPFTLMAGVHLAINATNAIYQETVRAYLKITYPQFVTDVIQVVDGHLPAPTAPGLGTALLPEIRTRPDVAIQVSAL